MLFYPKTPNHQSRSPQKLPSACQPTDSLYSHKMQSTLLSLQHRALLVASEIEKRQSRISQQTQQDQVTKQQQNSAKIEYQRYLIQQIHDKSRLKEQWKIDKLEPGISKSFQGYPNLVEPSKEQQQLDKLRKTKQFKELLDEQVKDRQQLASQYIEQERALSRSCTETILKGLRNEQVLRAGNKTREKTKLSKFWEEAQQAKIMKDYVERMDRQGWIPQESPFVVKRSRGSGNQVFPTNECLSSPSVSQKERAMSISLSPTKFPVISYGTKNYRRFKNSFSIFKPILN